jgi:uncharacterized protein (TIGR02996 family)
MTSEHDLLRAVLDDPAADAPRLAFADWLAASGGEPGRAQVIREHLATDGPSAEGGFTQELGGVGSRDISGSEAVLGLGRSAWRAGYAAHLHWHRGFVDRVELPAAAFFAHAADLFTAHPIVAVRLTDKLPSRSDEGTGAYSWGECPPTPAGWRAWHRPGKGRRDTERVSDLASELFAAGLPRAGFATAGQADDALSAVCVAYGRRLAHLRPLA